MPRTGQAPSLLTGPMGLRLHMLVGDSYNPRPAWKRDPRRASQILERGSAAVEHVKKWNAISMTDLKLL